jgi:hypothetical protein
MTTPPLPIMTLVKIGSAATIESQRRPVAIHEAAGAGRAAVGRTVFGREARATVSGEPCNDAGLPRSGTDVATSEPPSGSIARSSIGEARTEV